MPCCCEPLRHWNSRWSTIYETFLDVGVLDDEQSLLVERFIESHLAIAAEMGELTEAIGGVAWECTNPWYMNRLVDPLLVAIQGSDNPNATFSTAWPPWRTSQLRRIRRSRSTSPIPMHRPQRSLPQPSNPDMLPPSLLLVRGPEGYVSPTIGGGGVQSDADGIPFQFSITDTFGSTGQIELVVGAPNENGVRETFVLQTPSLNALIYNELEPTC